ncbi:hypothetical protein [Haloarcula marina]|nr:hypothetical protein [Halomicroarcula marina]
MKMKSPTAEPPFPFWTPGECVTVTDGTHVVSRSEPIGVLRAPLE